MPVHSVGSKTLLRSQLILVLKLEEKHDISPSGYLVGVTVIWDLALASKAQKLELTNLTCPVYIIKRNSCVLLHIYSQKGNRHKGRERQDELIRKSTWKLNYNCRGYFLLCQFPDSYLGLEIFMT